MRTLNVAVFSGYDVLANEIKEHHHYIRCSFERAIKEKIELIILIGGATNPDYPYLTEAEANRRIIEEIYNYKESGKDLIQIYLLPIGNTAAEGLKAVREYIFNKNITIDKLLLCMEISRLTGFMIDSLYVKLNDIAHNLVVYGYRFPESEDEFDNQRKKLSMKIMSHRCKMYKKIRNYIQKIHQIKMAKKKSIR
ncbi:hypothetical protein ACFLZ0_01865 [Patescibacteria group bacterium]